MMTDRPPIPEAIWKRITAWLKAGGTGQITLEANRGRVSDAYIRERIRDEAREESLTPPERHPDRL
jgi:hypothetical protein